MTYAHPPLRLFVVVLVLSVFYLGLARPSRGADTSPPVLGAILPASAIAGSAYNVSVAYSDDVGVTSCGLYVNKTFIGPMTLTGTEAIRVHTFPQLATYAVEIRCYDADGNETKTTRTISTFSASGPINPNVSGITALPTTVAANGSSFSTVTVKVRTVAGRAVSGVAVTLFSSRGSLDSITPDKTTSASDGSAVFTVRSSKQGISQYTATANGTQLAAAVTVVFVNPNQISGTANPGNLMKLPCPPGAGVNDPCKAVYYYGGDKSRHAFPNEKAYFTWYNDFSGITEVTSEFMASVPLGKNVTYRPGIRMVKFATLTKVYAVSQPRTLRWIASEELASALYGPEWNKNVHDINDVFFNDYRFGADIASAGDYRPSVEAALAPTVDANF